MSPLIHKEDQHMDRFWSKVDMNPHHCWEWLANTDKNGYGTFRMNGKIRKAHRVAYELVREELPKYDPENPIIVRHKCDNPPCVNPEHLILGTQADNAHDRGLARQEWALDQNPLQAQPRIYGREHQMHSRRATPLPYVSEGSGKGEAQGS